jgi:hypothetical protein
MLADGLRVRRRPAPPLGAGDGILHTVSNVDPSGQVVGLGVAAHLGDRCAVRRGEEAGRRGFRENASATKFGTGRRGHVPASHWATEERPYRNDTTASPAWNMYVRRPLARQVQARSGRQNIGTTY